MKAPKTRLFQYKENMKNNITIKAETNLLDLDHIWAEIQ